MASENTPFYIDAVPPELWENIFLYAIPPPNRNFGDQDDRSRLDTSLTLSHTCVRRRDIALSRPLLWNTLSLRFHFDKQTPNQHVVDLMITRSANAPLSIDLRMTDIDDTIFTDQTSTGYRSLETLSESIARWKDVGLYLRGCPLPLPLSEKLNVTGAPSLESLRLDVALESRDSDALLVVLWTRSPRLRKLLLSVSGLLEHYRSVPRTVPYTQITSLYIHTQRSDRSIGLYFVLSVLHSAPNLVSCVMSNINEYRDPPIVPFSTPQEMFRLEYFHLGLRLAHTRRRRWWPPSTFPLTNFLNYVTAPSLMTLAFSNMNVWVQAEFERFIARSGCSLDEMHFFNPYRMRLGTLIPILQSVPSIKGIHLGCLQNLLKDPTFVPNMIAWNPSRSDFELCPNLSWLSFHDSTAFDIQPDCDINALEMGGLVRILKTRSDPPDGGEKRFERVYVPSDKLTTEAYPSLQALCADPYALDVQSDEDMYNIHNLWARYCKR